MSDNRDLLELAIEAGLEDTNAKRALKEITKLYQIKKKWDTLEPILKDIGKRMAAQTACHAPIGQLAGFIERCYPEIFK